MPILEDAKRAFERVTGLGQPSLHAARAAVRARKAHTFHFDDDDLTPNNSRLPLVVYRGAVNLSGASDPAAMFEVLFESNGWGEGWRGGVYDYDHYHSAIHEVLGIARGRVEVRFGGEGGKATGHKRLAASDDLLVVGSYPPTGRFNLRKARKGEREESLREIPRTPAPRNDPVYGRGGAVARLWARPAAKWKKGA
ncbi:MAG: cupin [Alphaproteobacteria bacterium]|nr:cupin [Alphaproteobacteria bacterium]